MAFDNLRIEPNFNGGTPREREHQPREYVRRDPTPQLNAEQQERAYRYARLHRMSVGEACRLLFEESD